VSADEILAEVQAASALPNGHAKAQRLEVLASRAKEAGDPRLEAQVLITLSHAHEFGAEKDKLPIVFGRLLSLLDQFPDAVGSLSHTIHWQLKWMTSGLLGNPDVPLAVGHRWLAELEARYRQKAYSLRPVLAQRALLALDLGDFPAASAHMEASIAAARDQMADCQACERNDWGRWQAALGDDDEALSYWEPVLDGDVACAEEPHRVLGHALLPLLRIGRPDEARGAFLRGYSLARQKINLMASIGQHIEFCALTGNEARGLEILTEHHGWLADRQATTRQRLDFIGGVTVLLRRLTVLGHGSLPVGGAGTHTIASLTAELEAEIRDICERYDARNGTTVVSDAITSRLRRRPFVAELPLGLPSRLPAAGSAKLTRPAVSPARPGADASLDELVAHASELAAARHPETRQAWARVAAAGQDLSPDVAARVARARAGGLLQTDPRAAHEALLDAAGQFARIGDLDGELEASATAATALQDAGDPAESLAVIKAVRDRAAGEFAAGRLTPRSYLNVLLADLTIMGQGLHARTGREAGDVAEFASRLKAVLATAQEHGQAFHAGRCHDLLATACFWQRDRDAMVGHLVTAREMFQAAEMPWFMAVVEARLAESALQGGDPQQAESYVRDAQAHAIGLSAEEAARLASLRAMALRQLPERAAEFADASLTAATRWDGISEPDTLHNTFNAARAYAQLGRHAEAAVLFAEAMPKVGVPYDQTASAQTRQQYARSLRALGRHRDAAAEFLEAARLVADDPANAAAHAFVAAEAAAELRDSGQDDEALAVFERAAELFAGLGNTVGRVRCLRSAAWVSFSMGGEDRQAGVAGMRSVLSSLESPGGESMTAEELADERENTVKQLERMLQIAREEEEEAAAD
jgi:tetratricopeptide (TPR) repeat protein